MTSPEIWHQLSHDPRDPAYAGMRASDADRDVVLRALGEAYAEGRLTPLELDERTTAVQATRTLGELPPFLADLVPTAATPATPARLLSPTEIEAAAVERWRRARREVLRTWVTVSLICWVIYLATGFGGHPWPVYPMLGTGLPLLGVVLRRQEIVEDNRRRLVAKQEKAIAKAERKRRELEGPA